MQLYAADSGELPLISDAVILMDAETGQVLYEKNSRNRMYPASTTKIMTALLLCEMAKPYEMLTVSETAIAISEPRSSHIALRPGEELTAGDALYALMLASANDAANVLAEHAAGDLQSFARLMTERAHQIGALDTRFENAHGLHEDGHYSTAYDIALMTRYAMGNENFMRYFGGARYTMPPTNLQPEERSFTSHQEMLRSERYYYRPGVTGGKTGYTHAAQHTMSTSATQDGRTLICVVLHSALRYDKFKDTHVLLDYGFGDFEPYTLAADRFVTITLPASHNDTIVGSVEFSYSNDVEFLLHKDSDPADVRIRYEHPELHEINGDTDCVAVIELYSGGTTTLLRTIAMQPTVTLDPFPSAPSGNRSPSRVFSLPDWLPRLLWIPGVALILFIMLLILRGYNLRKRRRARQARLARARERYGYRR